MSWEDIFRFANTFALIAWLALVFLPRWARLKMLLRFGAISLLAGLYCTLVAISLFNGMGSAGFTTLPDIKALFASDLGLVAGWLHYLALDLFVGVWIAEQLDSLRISRFIQAPILIATFISGPCGLLLGYATMALSRHRHLGDD